MSSHDDIFGENGPDENIPTDPGVPQDEADEPTDPVVLQASPEEPTDPEGDVQSPVTELTSQPEEEAVTDPGVSTASTDEDFSSSLVAIILILAMVVFATQGDHKDKAWVAMVDQVEHWTGLDFSEPKWGLGGEEESE